MPGIASEVDRILGTVKEESKYSGIPQGVWEKIRQKSFEIANSRGYLPEHRWLFWDLQKIIRDVTNKEIMDSGKAFARVEIRGLMGGGYSLDNVLIDIVEGHPSYEEIRRVVWEVLMKSGGIPGPVASDVWVNEQKYIGPNIA